jgi:hypothetical protein
LGVTRERLEQLVREHGNSAEHIREVVKKRSCVIPTGTAEQSLLGVR